jgi:DNA-binding response OmpR family regulator
MAKIVVVEDDPSIRKLLVENLEARGHGVRSSSNGDEAIDFGYLFEPEVIIADWDLGQDYDGFEVAAACRHANENVKTIIISGHSERLKKFESDDHVFSTIAKPFPVERLVQCVEAAISS